MKTVLQYLANYNATNILLLLLLISVCQQTQGQALAFPEAVGFGKNAIGGRSTNARVYIVNTLSDKATDSGTLRKAVEASGPRIVVFRVGGVINLTGNLEVKNPFLTIAGQTAPGDGIVLKNGHFRVLTNNVIVRCMKFRSGDDIDHLNIRKDPVNYLSWSSSDRAKADEFGNHDAMTISGWKLTLGTVHNNIFDRCSISFGLDETVSIFGDATNPGDRPIKNMTVMNSIIADGLLKTIHTGEGKTYGEPDCFHSFGTCILIHETEQITLYQNILASCKGRMPRITESKGFEFINNFVYNWGYDGFEISGANITINAIGNYYKAGPSIYDVNRKPWRVFSPSKTYLYAFGNLDSKYRLTQENPDQFIQTDITNSTVKKSVPAFEGSGIVARPIENEAEFLNYLYTVVGSRLQNGMLDKFDENTFNEIRNNTGFHKDYVVFGPEKVIEYGLNNEMYFYHFNPAKRKGHPHNFSVYTTSQTTRIDADQDGMDDNWEVANGLNPALKSDATTFSSDNSGYLNIEKYINSIIPTNESTGFFNHKEEKENFVLIGNTLHILKPQKGTIYLYNSSGILIKTVPVCENTSKIDLSEIKTGVHFVILIANNMKNGLKFLLTN